MLTSLGVILNSIIHMKYLQPAILERYVVLIFIIIGPCGGVPMANYGEMANCAVVLGPIRHKNLRHNSP